MPEERTVISPISGAFFDKEVTKIGKGVSTIEKSSKKTNELLMALIRFLKSDVGRQVQSKEKDIDLGDEDFSFIADGFEEVVNKNIEQVNKQAEKQISVIEAETKAKREQAKIEQKKQSDIAEKQTKEHAKQVKADTAAKKDQLANQLKHDEKVSAIKEKEAKKKTKPVTQKPAKIGKDFKKELDDIEKEQGKTRKEIAKLQKKERKEIYKAKQEEAKKYVSAKATKTVNKQKEPVDNGKDLSDDFDSILGDVADLFKRKKKKPQDVLSRRKKSKQRSARGNRAERNRTRTSRTGRRGVGSVADGLGEAAEEVLEETTESGGITAGDVLDNLPTEEHPNRTEDRGGRTKEQKRADRLKRKRDAAREQRRTEIRNRRAGGRFGRFRNRISSVAGNVLESGKNVVQSVKESESFGKVKNATDYVLEKGKNVTGVISEKATSAKEGIKSTAGKVFGSFGSHAAEATTATSVATTGMEVAESASKIKGIPILSAVITAASALPEIVDTLSDEEATNKEKAGIISEKAGGVAGSFAGAAIGGEVGAAIGSVVPVVGTAIGGLIGSIGGAIAGEEVIGSLAKDISDAISDTDFSSIPKTFESKVVTPITHFPEKIYAEIPDSVKDGLGAAIAVPMALVSEDARKALGQDIERFEEKAKEVVSPILKLPETVYNNIPEAVKQGIGMAVAAPMALVSEDARNALKRDFEENIIPSFQKNVVSPITDFGREYYDKFETLTKSVGIFGEGIVDAGATVLGGIKGAFSKGWGALTSGQGVVESVKQAGGELGKSFESAKGITSQAFSKAYDNYKGVASDTMGRLKQDFGLTDVQAAAVVGNFGHESGGMQAGINEIKPLKPGSRGGYGWAQWTGSRRKALEAFAAEKGMPVDSNETQYQFLAHELQTTHKKALTNLKQTDDLDTATRQFFADFESGGDPRAVAAMSSRLKYAGIALNENQKRASGQPTVAGQQTPLEQKSIIEKPEIMPSILDVAGTTSDWTHSGKPIEKTPQIMTSVAGARPIIPVQNVEIPKTFSVANREKDGSVLTTLTQQTKPVESKVIQSKTIESANTIADAATKLTTAITPIVEKVAATTQEATTTGIGELPAGIEPNKLYKVPGNIETGMPVPNAAGLPVQKASFEYYGSGQPNLVQQGLVQNYSTQESYSTQNQSELRPSNTYQQYSQTVPTYLQNDGLQSYPLETPQPLGSIQSGGQPTYPQTYPTISQMPISPIANAETYGTITINAGQVMVNGNVSGENYGNQGTGSNTSSSFFNNFGSSSVYSGVSYGSNPVDNAVGAITSIPGSILGGLFGNLMGNVSSAINAPQNIMSAITGQAQNYASSAMSLPQNAVSSTIGMMNSTIGMPVNMLNNTVGSARGMANSIVGVPLGAYQSVNNAASSIYNIPNNAQNAFSNVSNNAANFGNYSGGYSSYSTYQPQQSVLPDVGSIFSPASYGGSNYIENSYSTPSIPTPDVGSMFSTASYGGGDSARITEAYPTGFQIERSNYEPMSMQMPEINIPEPQMASRDYSQPLREVPKPNGADLIAGGQTHRPSIDEIPININDSGLMLLNIGYL